MEPRVLIRRSRTSDEVTAFCPDLPGISATAPSEKEALELLRGRIDEHFLRQALAEHAQQAAAELAGAMAAERTVVDTVPMRRPRRHPPRVAEPIAPGEDDPAHGPRPAPAPSPMRTLPAPRPSIDRCISTLFHDVLRHRDVN